MSDLDRLHEIIDTLPVPQPLDDQEFFRRLAMAPEEDLDGETAARILAAEVEPGESVPHDELKRRLGL